MYDFRVVAVDFDGTLCEDRYPFIGKPNTKLIDEIKRRQANGDRIILWTCRSGDLLKNAVRWCYEQHGLIFDAVNENIPGVAAVYNNDSRKVFADEYIDDRATKPVELLYKKKTDILKRFAQINAERRKRLSNK